MKKNFVLMMLVLLTSIFFTSCRKDLNEPEVELVEVSINTQGLYTHPLLKSAQLNIDEWVINYNPFAYDIIFSGSEIYTYSKSINELKSGFTIKVLPGTYNVSYKSIHQSNNTSTDVSMYLDIVINEVVTITNSGEVTLTAQPDDYLVIVDIPNLETNITNLIKPDKSLIKMNKIINTSHFEYSFGYLDVNLSSLNISIQTPTNGILTTTINNISKGNIYHIVAGKEGTLNFNFVELVHNQIMI